MIRPGFKRHRFPPDSIRSLHVILRPIGSLNVSRHNARTHGDRQIRQNAARMRQFGWTNPILVDDQGGALADNRLAEKAGWDRTILASELQFPSSIDCSLEVPVTGFEAAEIVLLIQDLDGARRAIKAEAMVLDQGASPVSQKGDLWIRGHHRLLCGDARDPDTYASLLSGERADLILADPTYNLGIDGNVCRLGQIRHRAFAMACGEIGEANYVAFLTTVLSIHSLKLKAPQQRVPGGSGSNSQGVGIPF